MVAWLFEWFLGLMSVEVLTERPSYMSGRLVKRPACEVSRTMA